MDTTNQTSATTAIDQLKTWWDAKHFDAKEFCTIDTNGALKVAPFTERIMATLNHITGDAVIQNLIDKYADLTKQTEELEKEWSSTEDKLKLLHKINRMHEYLQHVNAIGNFKILLDKVAHFEEQIKQIIEKNYQQKLALIKNAEAITVENNNWKEVTQQFKDLGEQWKSIGFVDKKRNEELWEKFESIKTRFFENKRNHQEDIGKEMLQNLDLKMELVDKAEGIAASENWKETTEIFKQLLEDWKNIGRTLPEKNEALWQRFIAAKNHFFDRKKIHTDQIKVEQEANYEKKLAIVAKAETLKNSTEWAITTQAFNELMTEWRAIGPVPSEHNNSLWENFSAAKEVFFNAKRAKADAYKIMLDENLLKKQDLISRAEAIKNSSSWRETTEEMNQLLEEWKQVGHVGKEHSDTLWENFLAARKYFFNRKDAEWQRKEQEWQRKEQAKTQEREQKKQQEEKNRAQRIIDLKKSLEALLFESQDEEAQIIEFKESLNTISEGPKSEELKLHLSKLIIEIEQRIKDRIPKIAQMKNQIEMAEKDAAIANSEGTSISEITG